MSTPNGGPGSVPGRIPDGRAAAYTATGVLFLLDGLVQLIWLVRSFTRDDGAVAPSDYFGSLLDAGRTGSRAGDHSFDFAMLAGLLVVGLLALAKRRAARGAALVLAAVGLVAVRVLVGLHNDALREAYTATTESTLSLLTVAFEVLVSVVVLIVMARASERAEQRSGTPMAPSAYLPPPPPGMPPSPAEPPRPGGGGYPGAPYGGGEPYGPDGGGDPYGGPGGGSGYPAGPGGYGYPGGPGGAPPPPPPGPPPNPPQGGW